MSSRVWFSKKILSCRIAHLTPFILTSTANKMLLLAAQIWIVELSIGGSFVSASASQQVAYNYKYKYEDE